MKLNLNIFIDLVRIYRSGIKVLECLYPLSKTLVKVKYFAEKSHLNEHWTFFYVFRNEMLIYKLPDSSTVASSYDGDANHK